MISQKTLQAKIIWSVLIIVTTSILCLTLLVTWYEKNRFQQMEFKRIFWETSAVKKQLGHLMFSKNLRYLMLTLTNAKASNPSMLYFLVTDMNGTIIASDKEEMVGLSAFETASVKNISKPLYSYAGTDSVSSNKVSFNIFHSRLNHDLYNGDLLIADKGEVIFDSLWDISYMGEKLGTLRVGTSREGLIRHLVFLVSGMLGTGFFVLILTLILLFVVIKNSMHPLEKFISRLSDLHRTKQGKTLRKALEEIDLDEGKTAIYEIQNLKLTFLQIRDLFVSNWDQLENHRNNLEQMVKERTLELHDINEELTRRIEERKEIETRLLNVQKLESVGTLAGGVAHEFNNLFMAITGYATLIRNDCDPQDPSAKKADKIMRLVNNGSMSIRQLLGFARSGRFDPGLVNMNEVLMTSLSMFGKTRKDIEIVTQYAKDLWHIHADRSQLEQVVMNLLLNASEAMPGEGKIFIGTLNTKFDRKQVRMNKKVTGRFIQVTIKDQGRGIKQEFLQRVFDPFFTTKQMSAGTGLGLASVYGIVEDHEGFINVESQEDKGTMFSLFLPAVNKKELKET